MPFEDEAQIVELVAWRPQWSSEFGSLARRLGDALSVALAIQHIGSTSVPELSAVSQLAPYGQIKGAALPLLMSCAEKWATETGWTPREATAA